MTIEVGSTLPEATLLTMGANGPEQVSLHGRLKGRKVVVFGLPGAYTGTCSTLHLPSFIRTAGAYRQKGVDEILCITVNDPFVTKAWAEATGAAAAGIAVLADADGSFTRAIGMAFDAPQFGLYGRSGRYAALVEDGVVRALKVDAPGACELSTGESLLEAI